MFDMRIDKEYLMIVTLPEGIIRYKGKEGPPVKRKKIRYKWFFKEEILYEEPSIGEIWWDQTTFHYIDEYRAHRYIECKEEIIDLTKEE